MENQDFFELLTDKIINQIKEYILCHYPSINIEEVISFMTLLIDDAYLLEDASVYENLYFEAVAKKCVPEALFDIREDLQEFHQTVKEKYDLDIPQEDFHTIGGYVFGLIGREPEIDDVIEDRNITYKVLEIDGMRISRLEMKKVTPFTEVEKETATEQEQNESENEEV